MSPLDKYKHRTEIHMGVFKCQNKKRPVIIKRIKLAKFNKLEYNVPRLINSKYIMKLRNMVTFNDHVYLYMKYMKRGDMRNNQDLDGLDLFDILIDVANAIKLVHQYNYIHNDVKLANVMLTEYNTAKLADFGLCLHKNTNKHEFLGTIPYMSIEKCRGFEYDEYVDIWAFGVMIYKHVVGVYPFDINKDNHRTFDNWFIDCSKIENLHLRYICFKILQINDPSRITIDKILLFLMQGRNSLLYD